ncbi:hypothetical protein HMPREF9123_0806, partial [Neisseria bacilliformis ATCC BAA-1200]
HCRATHVGCVAPRRRTRSPPPDQSAPFFKTQTACVACATHPT